jgi:hypothetical protein
MKSDNKVFISYILIILVYGASYFLTAGSFAFSPAFSDFGLGLISIGLFFNKKISKYSFLLISLAFSLFYLIADTQGFILLDRGGFNMLKNITLILFSLFLMWDLNKGRYRTLRLFLWCLAIVLVGFFIARFTNQDFAFDKEFSFYKNAIAFLLICVMLTLNSAKSTLSVGLKRIIIAIGLSFFIEIVTYLVQLNF